MRMNKYLFILMMFVVIVLTGCGAATYEQATGQPSNNDFANGYFTEVYDWNDLDNYYHVVYANDTKVMYVIIGGLQYQRGISPLYNADGSLQIYKGEE